MMDGIRQKKKRELNYDILRMLSCIAVIILHVSATFTGAFTNPDYLGEIYTKHAFTTCVYNALSRFAVPCFLMLTGAFLLDDEKNAEFGYFYRRKFKAIGMPVVIFSILYIVYNLVKALLKDGMGFDDFKEVALLVFKGAPFYHMWYMTVLVGVYLLIPVVIMIKNKCSTENFSKVAWCFLIMSGLGYYIGTYSSYWNIGFQFLFLGYVLVGYDIKRIASRRKSNLKGTVSILMGVMVLLIIAVLRYHQMLRGIADTELKLPFVEPLCLLPIIASICIFYGFSLLDIKVNMDLRRGAENTFWVYLIHAGVWDVCTQLIERVFGSDIDSRVAIPLGVIIVFAVSWLLAIVCRKLYRKVFG